jgi:hypothetical protein
MNHSHGMQQPRVFTGKATTCELPCHDIPSGIVRRSGIPWPVMRLEAKWYRFRFVNAGPSRPYMLKIKNQTGLDVQQQACYVIATDAGEWCTFEMMSW